MQSTTNKKIYPEIFLIKGIAIVLVVFYHSTPNILPALETYISLIFTPILMPVFFFSSGFLCLKILKLNTFEDYKFFISDKLKRLIIPYFIISLIVFFPKLLLKKYAITKTSPNMFFINLIFFGESPVTNLWFLYVLFFILTIYPYFLKKNTTLTLAINIVISYIAIKLNLDKYIFRINEITYFSNFFIIGFLFRIKLDSISQFFTKKNYIICIVVTFIFFCIISLIPNSIFILNIAKSLFGIILFSFICCLIVDKPKSKIFLNLGYYSYDIYLLSWFPQVILRIILNDILHINSIIVFILCLLGGLSTYYISKYIFRNIPILNKYILGNFK